MPRKLSPKAVFGAFCFYILLTELIDVFLMKVRRYRHFGRYFDISVKKTTDIFRGDLFQVEVASMVDVLNSRSQLKLP